MSDDARVLSRLPGSTALLRAVAFVVAINVVGSVPGVLFSPDSAWFRALEKPQFYPPEIAFPVVWTLLFTLMGVALWLVWERDRTGRGLAIGLFAVQMAFNVAWTPVFFGLEELFFGLVVIVSLWVVLVATIVAFSRVDRRAAALLVPYLAWVTFAAVLNAELWRLNA
ncbi:TspO/MBR family protein [Natrialbaceae archaeon AArc-T1-2]|uniref:TspO/MBR family protein n=1 Tax=Natrialbaceae archaeon AArc-T1-2 TaxID=3053904 RepID=UPI00255A9D55|nr:TspO/MBR family protein [Natrialbaceae archaeon AArc-T1-2]WIV65656.1 TspO/MBR family protein [Natrialbaceae archaeon AArc-T1-2]